LSACFNVDDALNFIAVDAGTLIDSPVRGLRPVRAARWVVLNEPKPGHATLSPDLADDVTMSKKELSTRSASPFETPALPATLSKSSLLLMVAMPVPYRPDHPGSRIDKADGVLPDGRYDVFVVDANDVDGMLALDLTVLSGAHKGDVVTILATGVEDDPIELLGTPAVLHVEDGAPRVVFDD
jgi:hypothetical protein